MRDKRKWVLRLAVWFGVGLIVALALAGAAGATRHDNHPEGAVAYCNWADFEDYGHQGFNWRWVRCNHTLHNHYQDRNGAGTAGHTVTFYRREARVFRAYCGID